MNTRMTIGSALADEWKKIFTDRVILVILLIGPIFYTFFFASLYSHRAITDVSTVVYDEDHSQLSQEIIQALDAHMSIKIVGEVYSEAELQQTIDEGSARAAVVIPAGLDAKLKHGTITPVITFVDGTNLMITNSVLKGANEVIATYSYGASSKKLMQQGLQDEQVSATMTSIPFSSRTLYNPTFDYEDFLVIGMAATTLQQVILMAGSMTIAREKEEKTWGRFAVWKRSPWKIAFVKMFPYWMIGILNVFVVLSILTSVYKLSFRGSVWSLLLIAVVFSFTVAAIGYVLSLILPNKITALQISMLVALPSFSLSGHSWPMEAMPKVLANIAHGLPLTYFLEALRTIMLKGLPTSHILNDCISTAVIGLIALLAGLLYSRFVSFKNITDDEEHYESTTPALPIAAQPVSAAPTTTVSM
ncbi:ABC transporter permease [Paenibacillus sp. M1]|uniref:ABC transporter permease n=1 Tax=Paenibacillus haidiansis TaxID=1574488 RepID=A0ABU7VWB9_9BACL